MIPHQTIAFINALAFTTKLSRQTHLSFPTNGKSSLPILFHSTFLIFGESWGDVGRWRRFCGVAGIRSRTMWLSLAGHLILRIVERLLLVKVQGVASRVRTGSWGILLYIWAFLKGICRSTLRLIRWREVPHTGFLLLIGVGSSTKRIGKLT